MTSRLHIDAAVRSILDGGVIAYPTEAVYGLGCLPLAGDAVERILQIKRRRRNKGLIVVAADFRQLEPFVSMPTSNLRAEIESSWPGPATWVLPVTTQVPEWLTGGRQTLAVRVTDHPVVRSLCQRAEHAIVSTSANRTGQPALRTPLAVRRKFGREIDYVLAGLLGDSALPTVIRDGRTGEVIRAG